VCIYTTIQHMRQEGSWSAYTTRNSPITRHQAFSAICISHFARPPLDPTQNTPRYPPFDRPFDPKELKDWKTLTTP
jgi:hypothetical protein